jgi:hypothetical protein
LIPLFTLWIPLIYDVPDHFPNLPILLAQKPLTSHLDFTILTGISDGAEILYVFDEVDLINGPLEEELLA